MPQDRGREVQDFKDVPYVPADFEMSDGALIRYSGDDSLVVVPDGVTSIGECAFVGCELTLVMLPHTLTSIGDRAFYDSGLADIAIPDSVTSIGKQAFGYYVERFTIGEPIEHKDEYFTLCGRKGGPAERYAMEYGMQFNVLEQNFEVEDGVLKGYGGNYGLLRIPNQVTAIGDNAFRHYWSSFPYISTVVIPDGVTRIGDNAFYDCTDLQFLYLPDSLKEIGSHAFFHCRSLKDVTVPSGVTKIGTHALGFFKEEWEAWDVGKESAFTIRGERGSVAERYAQEHGFTFVSF